MCTWRRSANPDTTATISKYATLYIKKESNVFSSVIPSRSPDEQGNE